MRHRLKAAGLMAAALTLTACGSNDEPEAAPSTPPSDPLEQMLITFNGSPSRGEIQEALDDALNATGTPVTNENYSRAGSVLTTFRQERGVDEMDVLECMPTAVTDSRIPEVTFPNVASVCLSDLTEGTR